MDGKLNMLAAMLARADAEALVVHLISLKGRTRSKTSALRSGPLDLVSTHCLCRNYLALCGIRNLPFFPLQPAPVQPNFPHCHLPSQTATIGPKSTKGP